MTSVLTRTRCTDFIDCLHPSVVGSLRFFGSFDSVIMTSLPSMVQSRAHLPPDFEADVHMCEPFCDEVSVRIFDLTQPSRENNQCGALKCV